MKIVSEKPCHAAAIEALLEESFGPSRLTKTVYRLRDGVAPLADLGLVALDEDGVLKATLRFWEVQIFDSKRGSVPVLLLGPIAVSDELRGTGVGSTLMNEGLARAKALGHRAVLLVGDEPYYRRFGFVRALAENLDLPGPVDRDRFLGLELVPGALKTVSGMLGKAHNRQRKGCQGLLSWLVYCGRNLLKPSRGRPSAFYNHP